MVDLMVEMQDQIAMGWYRWADRQGGRQTAIWHSYRCSGLGWSAQAIGGYLQGLPGDHAGAHVDAYVHVHVHVHIVMSDEQVQVISPGL